MRYRVTRIDVEGKRETFECDELPSPLYTTPYVSVMQLRREAVAERPTEQENA